MAHLYVFLAFPAELLLTLLLKTGRLLDGKCPSHAGYVYDRQVSVLVRLVSVDGLSVSASP